MKQPIYRITGRHKRSFVVKNFEFSSIRQCAKANPDFTDFEIMEQIK